MVDNIFTKPFGLVLIAATHMVFNVHSQEEFTGILGKDITLQFKFWPNVNLTKESNLAVYKDQITLTKVDQYNAGKGRHVFKIFPENSSVFWNITNLKLNDSESYWVSLFRDSGLPRKSNTVKLIVQEENRSSTDPPSWKNIPKPEHRGNSSYIIIVLVVSPAVLLAAVLPYVIWCLIRTKDKQPSQQSSNSTAQETVEASKNVPVASLVYSVLDFPQRPSAVLDINPSDTEYAAVSYLPEKRRV